MLIYLGLVNIILVLFILTAKLKKSGVQTKVICVPNSEENCCETYFEKISWSKNWRFVPILSMLYVSKPLVKCLLSQLFLTILDPLSTRCSTETALFHVFSELWLPEIVARSQLKQIYTSYTGPSLCEQGTIHWLTPSGTICLHYAWTMKAEAK